MHPAIRLLCLAALAFELPGLPLPALLIGSAGLMLMHFTPALLAGLWRLRWMLLAILVLYGGFTPGEPLLPQLPGLSREGLLEGARRALVLVGLLQLVEWLLARTPLPQLCAGLKLLAQPLELIGLPAASFARRLGLALGQVAPARISIDGARGKGNLFDTAAALVLRIESGAAAQSAMLEVQEIGLPRFWEWLLPPALLLALLELAR